MTVIIPVTTSLLRELWRVLFIYGRVEAGGGGGEGLSTAFLLNRYIATVTIIYIVKAVETAKVKITKINQIYSNINKVFMIIYYK